MKLKIARSVAPTSNSRQAIFDLLPRGCALRQYVEWACQAYGSPPIYHLASGLAFSAYELCRRGFYLQRQTDGSKLPLTLWFCMIGDSGTGKSTAINALQDFAKDSWDAGSQVFPDPWLEPEGSVQGIVVALQDFYDRGHNTSPCLMYHHEAAQIFNTRESISEQLCKIADGRTFQANYRRNQQKKNKDANADRVVNPRVNLLVATTEAQLAPYFKDQHRSGGIFTRLMWLKPDFTQSDVRLSPDFVGAHSLIDIRTEALDSTVQWFAQLSMLENSDGLAFTLSQRGYAHLERRVFKPFKAKFQTGSSDNMHGVRMRLIEKARVFAALYASFRGSLIVEPCDIEYAAQLVWVLLEHTERMSNLGAETMMRYVDRVEEMIQGAGDDGLWRKDIYAKIRVDKKTMDMIFDTLADAGKVFQDWQNAERSGVYVHTSTQAGVSALKKDRERQKTAEEVKQAHRRMHQN